MLAANWLWSVAFSLNKLSSFCSLLSWFSLFRGSHAFLLAPLECFNHYHWPRSAVSLSSLRLAVRHLPQNNSLLPFATCPLHLGYYQFFLQYPLFPAWLFPILAYQCALFCTSNLVYSACFSESVEKGLFSSNSALSLLLLAHLLPCVYSLSEKALMFPMMTLHLSIIVTELSFFFSIFFISPITFKLIIFGNEAPSKDFFLTYALMSPLLVWAYLYMRALPPVKVPRFIIWRNITLLHLQRVLTLPVVACFILVATLNLALPAPPHRFVNLIPSCLLGASESGVLRPFKAIGTMIH